MIDWQRLYEEVLALESPVNVAYKQQLSLIKDSTKREKVANILRRADTKNIEGAASSTSKYHPDFAQNKGGLSRHTKAVVAFAAAIVDMFPDELDYDTMIIAALAHDISKYATGAKFTSKDHAAQAAELLKAEGLNDEARLVASHMGRWDKTAPHPKAFDERCLHIADCLASRQFVHIDFDESDDIIQNNNIDSDRIKLANEKARADAAEYDRDFLMGKNEGF